MSEDVRNRFVKFLLARAESSDAAAASLEERSGAPEAVRTMRLLADEQRENARAVELGCSINADAAELMMGLAEIG